MSLDVPTDIDERGRRGDVYCVQCHEPDAWCRCEEIFESRSEGNLGEKQVRAVACHRGIHCTNSSAGIVGFGRQCQGVGLTAVHDIASGNAGMTRDSEDRLSPAGTHRQQPAPYVSKRGIQHSPRSWCWWCVNAPTDSGACRWHSNSGRTCQLLQRNQMRSELDLDASRGGRDADQPGKVAGTEHRFPPRTPASPCRSERHCGDPSNGLWRDCCDSSRGRGFFQ